MTVDVQIDSRISKCEKILGSDPNSQIFAALADAYRRKGELESAFKVCQNGLRLHPEYGAAHVVMAKINLDRGLYDWAEAEVHKAAASDGNNRNIELLLAEIYIYKGDYQAAIGLLSKLSQADPGNLQVKKLLEIAERIPRDQEKKVGAPVAPESPPVAEPVEPASVAPKALSPRDFLREALAIEAVIGALYMNPEGLVIESEWQNDIEPATCGAALAEVHRDLNRELVNVSFGKVSTVLIETNESIYYLIQAVEGLFLILGNGDLNLGTLRMKMADLVRRVHAS